MRTNEKLVREVATLGGLPREDLVVRWIEAHGYPPPKGIKRGLLERSATWHLQQNISAATRQRSVACCGKPGEAK